MTKSAKLMTLPVTALVLAGQLTAKPKMKVQLYGETYSPIGPGVDFNYVYLILPNGDHALGMCGRSIGTPTCKVESFAPERRKKSECQVGNPPVNITCYAGEFYEAERNKNDIIIYGGAGKVTYHIQGSW